MALFGVAAIRLRPQSAVVKHRQNGKRQRKTGHFFRVEDVSRFLDWHPGSVRRAIREGRIRAVHVGQEWGITQEELERVGREGV